MVTKQALINLINANKPLVEVGITLTKGFNAETVIDELNTLADDLEASLSIYCKYSEEKDGLTIDATPEALKRIFGWQIERVPVPLLNKETGKLEGVWDNYYFWEEIAGPIKFPSCIDGKVTQIIIVSPGSCERSNQSYP